MPKGVMGIHDATSFVTTAIVGAAAATTTIRYSKCGPFFVYLEH